MELSDFCLKRLFNPDNSEYLPIEEQLQFYKQRDLSKTKNYGTVLRIWGQPRSRRRVIIAPPMNEVSGREMMGRQSAKYLKPLVREPKNMQLVDRALSEIEKAEKHQNELKERTEIFHKWLGDRKQLRESLDQMGLDEKWLMTKEKTPLEQRVYNQMRDARLATMNTIKKTVEESSSSEEEIFPKIKRPLPEAMEILSKYLSRKRQRVIDLFSRADKDKNWTISNDEFRKCLKEAKIEMAPQLLKDLIESLDKDNSGEIDYKELAGGMKEHQKGMRYHKTKQALSTSPALTLVPPTDRIPSAVSGSSPSSCGSLHLDVPPTEITEQITLAPDTLIEKRKREKHFKKSRKSSSRSDKVKTNILAIDQHSRKSTLEGETGESIDRFREDRLKEYHQVLKLCKKHDVNLTPKLLQQALLYPGDQPHKSIKLKSSPGQLLSSNFSNPPETVKHSTKTTDPDKIHVSSTGEMLIEARHAYPLREEVMREGRLMTLSSGKAYVSRKVDCWMTFEEYTELTRHLSKRYISMTQSDDPSVFWPGHMLDKLQLYLPRHKDTQSIFSSTHQSKRSNLGYNNDLNSWPIDSNGYVKMGAIDQLKSYSLEGR
ncbi:EF-hand calcium-binding domain-containing protein 12-like isoform X2 [Antedon mediterranea]|uniref:EF-hand calcium-binding domain-containing protein 12-like isoform X2 n=1 Tax=Antedon mediterranea TaxID=105859 RepID=UPI003AF94245